MEAFVLTVLEADRELAADSLFGIGVAAVEERQSDIRGHVELWTHVGDRPESIRSAAARLARWPWRTVTVDDAAGDTWREHASPTWVTEDAVIVPAWLAKTTTTDAPLALMIDPGGAFGMGDHATTRLTMRSLLDELAARGGTPSVLDVGCGSGVLAIAAACLGAAPVVAIDVASAAIEATLANAAANGVGPLVTASTTPLERVGGSFDIVLANIHAPVLIDLAPHLRRVLKPGGALVVSGLLADRYQHVVDALSPLVPGRALSADGWVAVTLSSTQESFDLGPAGE